MDDEKGLHVFLLEDDRALAIGAVYALESEGFCVTQAFTIQEAKAILQTLSVWPDIFLLDVMLPDGSGYDFCKYICELRQEAGVETPPIIFLSACDSEANIVLGLEGGGDDYLTKPFGIRELLARIRTVLRRYQKGMQTEKQSDFLTLGSLKLDLHQLLLIADEEKIPLTSIEFRLLKALMQAPGKPLAREYLLERIWDMQGAFVDDNTLSVHIRHLREKLEKDPANPQILLTLRGVGYMLQIS